MASGFSSTYNPRTTSSSRNGSSLGLTAAVAPPQPPRVLFNNSSPPRPRYPLTDRSGVPLSRTRRRIVCGGTTTTTATTNNTTTMPPVSQTCRFFRAGLCQYGDRCRFFHIEVPTTATTTTTTSSEQVAAAASSSSTISNSEITALQPLINETTNTKPEMTTTQQLHENNSSSAQLQQPTPPPPPPSDLNCVKTNTNSMYDKWLDAPEFVPSSVNKARMKSYAEAVNPSTTANDDQQQQQSPQQQQQQDKSDMKLCPYAEMHGVCSYSDGECTYLHGDICDLCGTASLHPFNQDKRKQHIQSCIEQHERNMELSFAVQRSKEKSCGVCFEIIMEKAAREQRFGILPNCNHCFCLTCIRKWRQAKQFDNKIIRACPECRVTSDFVCPSMYWVDTKEEKEKLIKDYKCALSLKNCKYFKQGRGKCPFGNKCFYLHALPDGTKTDVGPPPRQPRRQAHDGDIDVLQQIILWDFLDERENRWLYSITDDLEDLVAFFSDSEDSDWSDYEVFFD